MSERALLERFDLVAENPENIPLLRRYIVDLAIRGKLLETTDLDISASEMLKRSEAKADSLVKQGKLKKQKPLAPISSDEIPVTYASHCTFERLGNIANLQKGLTGIQSAIPGNYPLVVTAAARSTCDHYDFGGVAAIVPMVSSTGHGNASLNRLHYQEGKFALGTILCAVFPIDEELISARFLFEYLTAFKDELLVSKMNGTANVTLTVGKIAEVPIPIIAPAAQRRVDELMALCDQLEAAKNEREARRDRLVAASLHRIGTAPAATDETATETQSATPLREAARFHLDHLPRLTTRPEHIKQLRQTILNLAVRGRLVPQDPSDEPAAELLARKVCLPSGYTRRRKILKETSVDAPASLFPAIPLTWKYTDIQSLYDLNVIIDYADGNHGALYPRSNEFGDDGVTFVTAKDLVDGRVIWKSCAKLNEERANQLPKGWAQGGDVLLTHNATVGRVARIEANVGRFLLGTSVTFYRLNRTVLGSDFFYYLLKSSMWQGQLEAIMAQTTRNQVSIQKQAFFRVVVPPLAEQHRIVAKIDELMALCDQLEAQLTTTQTDSRRLLEAVLHEAFSEAD